MLPDLSSPKQMSWLKSFISSLVVISLCFLIFGCVNSKSPSKEVLKEALLLQLQLTQDSIDSLFKSKSSISIKAFRPRVEKEEFIQLGEESFLRVSGYFDWMSPSDKIRKNSPFELFLERGKMGQSWRLAKPVESLNGDSQDWITYSIPLLD